MIPIIIGKQAGQEKILRNRGMLGDDVSPALLERIEKTFGERLTPEQCVARIIGDVRARGDAALLDWTRKLDRVDLQTVAVSQDEIDAAYAETPAAIRESLELAATRVRAFHEKQKPKSWLSGKGEAFARVSSSLKEDVRFVEDENVIASGEAAKQSPNRELDADAASSRDPSTPSSTRSARSESAQDALLAMTKPLRPTHPQSDTHTTTRVLPHRARRRFSLRCPTSPRLAIESTARTTPRTARRKSSSDFVLRCG